MVSPGRILDRPLALRWLNCPYEVLKQLDELAVWTCVNGSVVETLELGPYGSRTAKGLGQNSQNRTVF